MSLQKSEDFLVKLQNHEYKSILINVGRPSYPCVRSEVIRSRSPAAFGRAFMHKRRSLQTDIQFTTTMNQQ